jgi:uncharacterized protein (DUF488 family)
MIFSIGHSNHALGTFLSLLQQADIALVADVRSKPASRFCPQYNREVLEKSLKEAGIGYLFLGDALGGKPQDKNLWQGDRPDYAKVRASENFARGIAALLDAAKTQRVAMLCAERDPKDCHRFRLIGRSLTDMGVQVRHILMSGAVETQQEVEWRDEKGPDLFDRLAG